MFRLVGRAQQGYNYPLASYHSLRPSERAVRYSICSAPRYDMKSSAEQISQLRELWPSVCFMALKFEIFRLLW